MKRPVINLHVLVVDDEFDIRELIACALARDPFFVVRSCASGREALVTAREWRPDLALLDVTLPDMDGTAVLERLRADTRTAPIPVVFMTGRAAECGHYASLGASGVIAKPFDPMALPDAMRRFVPFEGALSRLREDFLKRLGADASALSLCRLALSKPGSEPAVRRVNAIAHALAGAGGIYGFAGITCESAALSNAAEENLAGRTELLDVRDALDRLLRRIDPT